MDLSKEERREGNAILFNHVGYKRIDNSEYFIASTDNPETKIHIDDALYDVSWDWLMPLYKNISRAVEVKFKSGKMPGLLLSKHYELGQYVSSIYPIEAVWRKLVEYIKMYNKFKKSEKVRHEQQD